MEFEDFQNSTAGRLVLQAGGYTVFIPNPLPPEIRIDWDLTRLLSEAGANLGELSGAGRLLSNPHLLIQPYIRREAVQSSRIENTRAGMDDLFFFEADESAPPRAPDVREVSNYVHAMEYGLERLKNLPLSVRLIREIHEILMKDVRGGYATPGELRRTQNWIGPPGCTLKDATFVPPPVEEMKRALSDWEKYLNGKPKEPPLIQCAITHYQFEAIHPFIDGNGRVGRLLITFLLCERGLLSQPLLYLSSFFERNRDEYYRRLLSVSQKADWRGWIEYFLKGVSVQAENARRDAASILDIYEEIKESVKKAGNAPRHTLRIVDKLFMNPVIMISKLARELELPYTSVKRCVDFLKTLGVLRELMGKKRNRLFASQKLIEILSGK